MRDCDIAWTTLSGTKAGPGIWRNGRPDISRLFLFEFIFTSRLMTRPTCAGASKSSNSSLDWILKCLRRKHESCNRISNGAAKRISIFPLVCAGPGFFLRVMKKYLRIDDKEILDD